MPAEIKRRLTPLGERAHWKMRQTRNTFFYVMYPVFAQFKDHFANGDFILRQLVNLLHPLRSIAGCSVLPIENHVLEQAQNMITAFVKGQIEKYGITCATWKMHMFLHLLEDPRNFGCHAERISAESFETFHQNYKGSVHPGPKVHLQLK